MAKSKSKSKPKTKKKKTTIAGKLLRLISFLFLLILLISDVASFISPSSIWLPAFFGLFFPYIYVLNALIFLLWLIFRKRMALYIFIVLLITLPQFSKFFNLFPDTEKKEGVQEINVMSFNVRLFNKWNSYKDENITERKNKILDFISEQAPDLICIQEAYYDSLNVYKTIDSLKKMQEAKYVHANYIVIQGRHQFGVVTLSRFPIINKGHIPFNKESKNLCIFSDILVEKDTIRVYNAHFSSIGLSREDFVFIETVGNLAFDNRDSLAIEDSFKKISMRLKKAFLQRSEQVQLVASDIAVSPYPVIMCADLNDTPSSYAYKVLTKNLKDAFLKSGKGIGKTYNGILHNLRIDYILFSKHFKSFAFKTHYVDLSDHYPITASLFLKK